jgi:hypothetical protein
VKLSRSTALASTSMRRPMLAAGAVAAGLLLSSCGSTAPGVAAEIEGETITDEQVDEFAEVLRAIGGVQGSESGVPSKTARFTSLQILFTDQLAANVADVEAVSQESVASILETLAPARDLLTEDQQEVLDEVGLRAVPRGPAVVPGEPRAEVLPGVDVRAEDAREIRRADELEAALVTARDPPLRPEPGRVEAVHDLRRQRHRADAHAPLRAHLLPRPGDDRRLRLHARLAG